MRKSIRILAIALIVVITISFMPITENQAYAAGKVKLSKTKLNMYIGDTKTIKVKGTKKKVTWSSSNENVATVSRKGKINAKSSGTATIKAKAAGKTVKCKVTVKNRNTKVKYDEEVIKDELSKENDYTVNTDSKGNAVSVRIPKDSATEELAKGDVIMLPANEQTNGVAMKVTSIAQSGDSYTLKGSSPEMDEVFDSINIGRSVKADISDMVVNDDVISSASYSEGQNKSKSGISTADSTTLGDDITLKLFDSKIGKTGKLSGEVTLKAPVITTDIDINFWGGVNINRCNVDVQNKAIAKVELKASSKESIDPIYLGSINSVALGANFYVDVIFYLLINADGEAVVKCTVTNNTGFNYKGGTDISPYCNFTKSFEGTKAEVDAKLLANPVIAVRWGGYWSYESNKAEWEVAIVDLEAQFGPGLNASVKTYDTPPNVCADLTVYAYAMLGIKTDDGIGWIIKQFGVDPTWVILDKNTDNAIKSNYHIEDGTVVPKCTREQAEEEQKQEEDKEKETGISDEFRNLLKKYKKAITEHWSYEELEEEGLNYYFDGFYRSVDIDELKYTVLDFDKDGVYELYIYYPEGGYIFDSFFQKGNGIERITMSKYRTSSCFCTYNDKIYVHEEGSGGAASGCGAFYSITNSKLKIEDAIYFDLAPENQYSSPYLYSTTTCSPNQMTPVSKDKITEVYKKYKCYSYLFNPSEKEDTSWEKLITGGKWLADFK